MYILIQRKWLSSCEDFDTACLDQTSEIYSCYMIYFQNC